MCALTSGLGDELPTVHDLDLRVGFTAGVCLLPLHGLNDLLARDHLSKNHVDSGVTRVGQSKTRQLISYAIKKNKVF